LLVFLIYIYGTTSEVSKGKRPEMDVWALSLMILFKAENVFFHDRLGIDDFGEEIVLE